MVTASSSKDSLVVSIGFDIQLKEVIFDELYDNAIPEKSDIECEFRGALLCKHERLRGFWIALSENFEEGGMLFCYCWSRK